MRRSRAAARRSVRGRRGDRDRGRALPAVCDRPPRQSHARLRDADVSCSSPSTRRSRSGSASGRRRLSVGRRARDARRRARVPSLRAIESRISSTDGTAGLGTTVFVAFAPSRTRFATAPRTRGDRLRARRRARRIRSRSSSSGFRRRRRTPMPTGEAAGRASARRASPARDPARRRADGRCCSTIRRCSSGVTFSTVSSPRPRSRSRWHGCESRSGSQLAEVEASRTRIVEAGYEERRRLERDLHDGAQQRLVSLGVQLRRLQLSLPRDAQILSPALDQIVAEVGAAIADLRQIAAGVRPARLDDGLAAALRDLARTTPVPRRRRRDGERVPASVEAAAYFVACEAITNAVKHGSPSRVTVRAVRDNGTLHVTVSDDGVGGAVVRRGSGLAGLRDRVAAHGGTFEIVSPSGGGTHVEVAIPCEIVIAEDAVLLREGLAGLLEDAGHTVSARVGDAEALLAVVAEHEPDLAIVDVRMPPTYEDEGMRAAVEIRRVASRTSACSSSRSTSRAASRSSSSSSRRRIRLPAEGPGARRGRVPRSRRAGGERRLGARSRGREAAALAAGARRRSTRRAHAARARGARARRRGPDEREHREGALADREDGRDARALDPRASSICRRTATRTAASSQS